ncbi:MAG: FAD:protein FMN transferase [Lentisphaerae bacterium]|nr:FAD:protein FMN transferase [Lentisphaerota bacterium]
MNNVCATMRMMECFAVLVLTTMLLAGCSSSESPVTETWPVMGTFAAITVPATEQYMLKESASVARDTFSTINNRFSLFVPESDVSKINASAGQFPVVIQPETRPLLELCMHYAQITDGCFDPTISPLVKLWGFNGGQTLAKEPGPDTISRTKQLVEWRRMAISNMTAVLPVRDMKIDLGGIAKGYAVDECYNKLKILGLTNAIINLGGNMKCMGRPSDKSPWKIGVQNPFHEENLVGILMLRDGLAVATSGNYERFVTIEGKRYAHIIDPRTGRPVSGMAGVTVVSRSATEADVMSTALFVMGLKGAREVLSKVEFCEALFILDEQPVTLWITPGLEKFFKPTKSFRNCIRILTP